MRTNIKRVVAGAVVAFGAVAAACAGTLDDIKAQGVLKVGVKADSYPYGFLDTAGAIKGAEIDLAQAIADRLHVKFEPVIVQSSNRIQFLQQGKIDMLIATMADTPERRRVIDMVMPHYSYTNTNVLALKSKHYTEWEQLRGQTVCGQQSSTFNKWVEQTYGAKTMTFPTIDEAYAALRAGNCVAFINNEEVLGIAINQPMWKDYEMPLPGQLPQHHAIGVRKGDGDSDFGKFLAASITEWMKDGTLIGFYKKWNAPVDPYFVDYYKKAMAAK